MMDITQELPKQYDSAVVEKKWYDHCDRNGLFIGDAARTDPAFTIVIPPPNVTGALHLGHALNNTIQDVLIRWKRMQGYNTLWVPGTDHAGIATQAVVEKRLFEEEGLTRHDIGSGELVRRIWKWKDEYEARILGQLRMMGASCDWSRTRFTLDTVCSEAVRHTFYHFFKKGLIYRGKRLVNWDTHLQTAVADDEISYETIQSYLWYFRYPLSDGSGHLVIATTRPETMLGDTALAVHPDDERYRHLISKKVKLPFVDREIPIIADEELVDPAFGTGCVKVTPAHDPNDYATGLRHHLEMINILTPDGFIKVNGAAFKGQSRYEARKNIVEALERLDLVEKIEPYETQVGHSDRSKTPIEPYLSDQWFIKMGDLAESVIRTIREGRVQFFPERYAKSCIDWLSEKRDWCISRQLWWGHRIPIWYCHAPNEDEIKRAFAGRDDVAWSRLSEDGAWLISSLNDLPEDAVSNLYPLKQDPDVLDTWFSSALWPLSTLGWPQETPDRLRYYPTSVLVTSRDIISLWVARMILMGLENVGEVPFKQVYIHTKILDGEGRSMSKSLGNGVDPLDIIEKYGADALRFTMAALCTDNQDARLPVKLELLSDGRKINTSERFELGRNFCNKIWNATRFLLLSISPSFQIFDVPQSHQMTLDDKAILARLNRLIVQINDALSQYRFSETTQHLYDFFWHHFCDRYIEAAKPFLYGDNDEAKSRTAWIALRVLTDFIKLLQPFMPFITEEIWYRLKCANLNMSDASETVMMSAWPTTQDAWSDDEALESVERKYDLIRVGRNLRTEYKIAPSREIRFHVHPASAVDAAFIRSEINDIRRFLKASELIMDESLEAKLALPSGIALAGVIYMEFEDAFDSRKELARLENILQKLQKDLDLVGKKLSNTSFLQKAPDAIVEKERDKERSIRDEIQKVQDNIKLIPLKKSS
ncbi:MAG: valine--tRNA ligase [Chlamydiota bacterium]|nr:valine--tRNA ligase [Chlamydiota bacterium]